MPHHMRAVLAGLAMLGLSAAASGQTLAPNRALYAFEPSRISGNGQSTPVDGRIAYELTGNDCKGYEVDSRIGNIYEGEGGQKRIDLESNTFEAGDGSRFEVHQTQYINRVAGDDEHITVARNDDGTASGHITGTKKLEFTLKPEVMLPSAFEKKLIAAALRGEKRDVTLIYDGSDSEKVFRAITLIGPLQPPGSNAADKANPAAAPLQGIRSWHFSISYFPAGDDKAESPDYQTDFTMYENGVATEMVIDYGAYALKGKLSMLEMLPEEPCTPPAAGKSGTPQ